MAGIESAGIPGGTRPTNRGLGTRLAAAGVVVVIGWRPVELAEVTVAELRSVLGEGPPTRGGVNAAATAASTVVATPLERAFETARELAAKVVMSIVNALASVGRELHALVAARGSRATTVWSERPQISAAFRHLRPRELGDLSSGLDAGMPVCADDCEASEPTVALTSFLLGLVA